MLYANPYTIQNSLCFKYVLTTGVLGKMLILWALSHHVPQVHSATGQLTSAEKI